MPDPERQHVGNQEVVKQDVLDQHVENQEVVQQNLMSSERIPAIEQQAIYAQQQARRIRNTVLILAIAVIAMLIVGFVVAVILIVRSTDIQNVQDHIEARVTQTERAFCAYMEQASELKDSPEHQALANQASILIRRFGCETKGSLEPPQPPPTGGR